MYILYYTKEFRAKDICDFAVEGSLDLFIVNNNNNNNSKKLLMFE